MMVKIARRNTLPTTLDEGAFDLADGCLDALPNLHRLAMLNAETHLCYFNPTLITVRMPIRLPVRRPSLSKSVGERSDRRDAFGGVAGYGFGCSSAGHAAGPHRPALCAAVRLATRPVPLRLEAFPVRMIWQARFNRDPGTRWLAGPIQDWAARHSFVNFTWRRRKQAVSPAQMDGLAGWRQPYDPFSHLSRIYTKIHPSYCAQMRPLCDTVTVPLRPLSRTWAA